MARAHRRSGCRRVKAALPVSESAPLAANFRLTGRQIHDAIRVAESQAELDGSPLEPRHLYAGARAVSGRRLTALGQEIVPKATWERLVLPLDAISQLRELCDRVASAARLSTDWGFDRRLSRGRGINALFGGAIRNRQDDGRRDHGGRARPRPVPDRPGRRGQQVHRRDGEEPGSHLRRGRDRQRHPVLRRGGRAVRQAHRGQGLPRPLRQPRDQLSAAEDGDVRGHGDPGHQSAAATSTKRSSAGSRSDRVPRAGRSPTGGGSGRLSGPRAPRRADVDLDLLARASSSPAATSRTSCWPPRTSPRPRTARSRWSISSTRSAASFRSWARPCHSTRSPRRSNSATVLRTPDGRELSRVAGPGSLGCR